MVVLLLLALASPALAAPRRLAAGTLHSVALHNDGTVWTWGDNRFGQLGNGTTNGSATPARVPGLTGIVSVVAKGHFTVALKDDGTVWTWGANDQGQLGNGSYLGSTTPLQVSGLSGVVEIGAGIGHVHALKDDGSLWLWGSNNLFPVQKTGSGMKAVDGGWMHSIALKNDGTVWCWGSNIYGVLGIGSESPDYSPVPVMVPGLSGVIAVAAGPRNNFALKGDGTVWAWGDNYYGELGIGAGGYRTSPVQVTGLPGPAAAIATGTQQTVALLADGTVWSWGYNYPVNGFQQAYSFAPEQVAPASGITAIAVGSGSILALRRDGSIAAWGENSYGQLGTGAPSYRVAPVQVPGLASVSAVSSCSYCLHTLALRSDGTVWVWGGMSYTFVNGNPFFNSVPVQGVGLTGISRIAAGRGFSLALKGDGTVWSWGSNIWGQLGTGGTAPSAVPVQVPGLTGVIRIAAGENFSLALKNDGTVWGWGNNLFKQLGPSDITRSFTPVQIPGLSGVTEVSAGNRHGLAVKGDGSLWVWGGHGYGDPSSTSLVQVTPPAGVARAAGGNTHSMATSSATGAVYLWGSNGNGELCDGTTTARALPAEGFQGRRMKDVAAGTTFSLAVGTDGTVWSCGKNDYGQLGNGSTNGSTHATQTLQLADMVDIAAGDSFSVAVRRDGTVWAWGQNSLGQLGIDTGRQPVAALVNLGPQEATLTVTISGNGAGSVHSNPSGIACGSGTCSGHFANGSSVTLSAASAAGSIFTGWGGACSGPNPYCLLSMTSNLSTSATFATGNAVRIGSTGYPSLAAAYAAAPGGAVILAHDGDLLEGLTANRAVAVKLAGGYYSNFSGRSGQPTRLRGKVLLRLGTLRVDRIKVM